MRFRRKKQPKRKKEKVLTAGDKLAMAMSWICGAILWILFCIGRALGRIKILHADRLPADLKNTVIPNDHLALSDPLFVGALFFARYFAMHPVAQAPVIVTGESLYNSLLLRPFRYVMTLVDRQNKKKESLSVREMQKAQRPVIICPSGHREYKGTEFRYGKHGAKISRFKHGVASLALREGASVLPIGIIGTDSVTPNFGQSIWTIFVPWNSVVISIGEKIKFDEKDFPDMCPREIRKQVTTVIEDRILALMDEALVYQRNTSIRRRIFSWVKQMGF